MQATASDLEALHGARQGDARAGRLLMARHGSSMVRTAWRVLGAQGGLEPDVVVQEAFLAALTTDALHRGDVGEWLRSIVARKALDALRRSARRPEHPLGETLDNDPALATGDTAARQDDAITLRQVLGRLAPLDRTVLLLADVEGRSMAEIAETLGATRVAVKLRASRARRRLARMMREEQAEGRTTRRQRDE